jgi:hypothetical protein
LTCEPEGLCFASPVKARRAKARERLSSCRAPASGKTRRPRTGRFLEILHTRTDSPSVHPCPASDAAADFFLASALRAPPALASCRCERRAMRSTDVCHPIELRAPAPRVFLARSRHFRGGDTPRRLRLRAVLPGDRTFHDVRRPLRRIDTQRNTSCSTASRPGDTSVGVFFPRC